MLHSITLTSPDARIKLKGAKGVYTLTIPDGFRSDKPLELSLALLNTIIVQLNVVAGADSRVTLFEKWTSKKPMVIAYSQAIELKKNSRLKIITIQDLNKKAEITERRQTKVGPGARMDYLGFHLGSKKVDSDIHQKSDGNRAEMNIDLLCLVKKNQRHVFRLKNIHVKAEGKGHILAKGIASDESLIDLHGGVHVGQKGQRTESALRQNSLLLNKKAVIRLTPALKTETDDVKAGHSASVINLDDSALFYLTSRGIHPTEAKKQLIKGFAREVLDKLEEWPKIRSEVYELI